MKKIGLITLVVVLAWWSSSGQGISLSVDDLAGRLKWPSLGWQGSISHDGNFVLYSIRCPGPDTMIFQATRSKWKLKLTGGRNAVFTEDSQQAFFLQGEDSLCLLRLGSKDVQFIESVQSYHLISYRHTEWLI